FEVCPVRIDIPEVLVHLRSEVVEAHQQASRVPSVQDMAMKAASWTLSSSARTGAAEKAAGWGGRLAARIGRTAPGGRNVLGAIPGGPAGAWSDSRDVPVPAAESFRQWWERTDGGHRDDDAGNANGNDGGNGDRR
ncbi:DUF3390 domain-containing protein, partial [Pseudonocardia sp. DR1-2]|uniref:lactate utilisation protein LutB domain-containing protein n=1 Tax=Pseudonocardia sp. DR1-2 TaxID=2951168 RepID=UPI002043552A